MANSQKSKQHTKNKSISVNDPALYNRLHTWMTRIKREGNIKYNEINTSKKNNIVSLDGELEIRLGTFFKERYIGGLDIELWNTLKSVFNTEYIKCEHSVRIYYPGNLYLERYLDDNNSYKSWLGITSQSESGFPRSNNIIMDKVAIARKDFHDLGMRAAFKLEMGSTGNIEVLGRIIKERHRTRDIYQLGDYYELHLTKVTSFTGRNLMDKVVGYEAEIELKPHIDMLKSSDDVVELLSHELIYYLSIIEKTCDIRKEVVTDIPYRTLGIKRGGLMNKPGDLSVYELPSIVWRYTATDKADGERMFLVITKIGRMAMVSGKGAMQVISNVDNNSHKSKSASNDGGGGLFDGMMDYLESMLNNSSDENKKSDNGGNSRAVNYLDSVMPSKLVDEEWHGAIFDCEYLIDGTGRKRLYIFDCIGCGDRQRTYRRELLVRLSCVDRFCKSVKNSNTGTSGLSVEINAKTFYVEKGHLTPSELDAAKYLDNVVVVDKLSNAVCKLWNNRHDTYWYELDGIIMTALDGPYLESQDRSGAALGKPKKIYKWKDEQTIDVLIKKDTANGSSKWLFYTGKGSGGQRLIDEGRKIYFDSRRGLGKKGSRKVFEAMNNDQIIEMIWDNSVGQFVPYRNRTADKNWPNSPLTISSIIKLVERPVHIEDLVRYLADNSSENNADANSKAAAQFGKLYYQEVEQLSTRKRAVDINMRNFHNWVKAQLIKRISDANGNGKCMLLDLSVGKGGDMKKWLQSGVNVVVGIDISGTAIEEARRRYNEQLSAGDRRKMDAYFIHGDSTKLIDLTGNMCLDSVSRQEWKRFQAKYGINDMHGNGNNGLQTFDMIVSNFAIHYIIETDEQRKVLCQNLDNCLVPGGLFVGTLLDADIVRSELISAAKTNGGRRLLEAETDDGEVFYRIEASDANGKSSKHGEIKKIIVSRAGWANPIPEPAIGADELSDMLKNCSNKTHHGVEWSQVHLDTFKHLYSQRKQGAAMSSGERYISFMHKIFVAVRK